MWAATDRCACAGSTWPADCCFTSAVLLLGVACIPSEAGGCCCCTDLVCIWLQALKYLEQLLLYDGKRRMKALDAANVSHWRVDRGCRLLMPKLLSGLMMTLPLAITEPAGCLGNLLALQVACMWPEALLRCSTPGMQWHALQCSMPCSAARPAVLAGCPFGVIGCIM